jgi:hypothetical protein
LPELENGSILQQLLVAAVRDHNVLPLTGRCNLSCIFCSHRFNPPSTWAYSFNPLPVNTLLELISFLDPSRKIIIGESATRLREGEPLTHPDFFYIIKKIRLLYPETLLQVTTNGSLFSKAKLKDLAVLGPLELIISVNSSSNLVRNRLMNDPDSAKLYAAIELLNDYAIPFHGSIVALPHLVGFEDLRTTLIFLDQAGALSVRFLLPGFTKQTESFLIPGPDFLANCYKMADALQEEIDLPLLIEPPLVNDLNPVVYGVIRKSQAERSGMMKGDLIVAVNGKRPFSRVEAFNLIFENKDPELLVERDRKQARISLIKNEKSSSGVIMNYDLDPHQVDLVERALVPEEENLMLLSNPALKRWQIVGQMRELNNLRLHPVKSLWFGGTISSAGLLTVGDYQTALHSISDILRVRRILIPAISYDQSGYDLSGRHYLTLDSERAEVVVI